MDPIYRPDKDSVIYGDHTADLWIDASGTDLNSMLGNLVDGLYGVMSDCFLLEGGGIPFEMSFPASDRETSMVDALSELLFIFDSENNVIRDLTFHQLSLGGKPGFLMKGMLFKASIPAGEGGMEVKAVTYHGAMIKEIIGGFSGRILLDL